MAHIQRCFWVSDQALYQQYHDQEWGRACMDEAMLFEQLCLEGQQAGLSWWTVLQKRENYRQHFFQHSIADIAAFSDELIEQTILQDAGIIRHKSKLYAIRTNAQLWLQYREQSAISSQTSALVPIVDWLWRFAFYSKADILAKLSTRQVAKYEELSLDQLRSWYLSQQLKKMGFKFVGHQICHAFMQAVGMFNHHDQQCFCYADTQHDNALLIQQHFHP